MSTGRLTKSAGAGLSGVLVAALLFMSIGLLFALAPANPVSAQPVVTRHLPDTVQPGETFEVVVTFTAHADDFTCGFEDYSPNLPSDWLVTANGAWCTPPADAETATDNKVEYIWFPPPIGSSPPFPEGTQFTLVYRVTVPDNAVTGTYDFGAGRLGFQIAGGPQTFVDISGDYQVEVPKPDVVWVNDDWAGSSDGDIVDGRVFGYNAFATIQDGIEGVADSTVHVMEGGYDGFIVDDREDLSIIGQPGAEVIGLGPSHPDVPFDFMALVIESWNISISGLVFDGSGIVDPEVDIGIVYLDSTGSIDGVNVIAGELYENYYGIAVVSDVGPTVDISNTTVEGWTIGIYAVHDVVNVRNCNIIIGRGEEGFGIGILAYDSFLNVSHGTTITGLGDDGHSLGIVAQESVLNVHGSTIRDCRTEEGAGGESVEFTIHPVGTTPPVGQPPPYGIGVASLNSTAYITDCSKMENNEVGILVDGGHLDVSRSNIEGSRWLGVLNDGDTEVNARANWWGDATGPYHPEDNPGGLGDEVSDGVIFYPWLDASCPGGRPIGPVVDFVGVPRTGTAPLTVQFTDLSQGPPGVEIVSWFWEFGDGATSSHQHPTHTYTQPGEYTVSLTVTDEFGVTHDPLSRPIYITVSRERWVTPEPEPARMVTMNLLVSPHQVHPNQQVEIHLDVANQGGTAGSTDVSLYINGHFENTETVTVGGGQSKTVVFRVAKAQPGTYQVLVDGHEGQFTVMGTAPTHWGGPLGTGGIVAIIVIVIALVLGLVFVFRRQQA